LLLAGGEWLAGVETVPGAVDEPGWQPINKPSDKSGTMAFAFTAFLHVEKKNEQ